MAHAMQLPLEPPRSPTRRILRPVRHGQLRPYQVREELLRSFRDHDILPREEPLLLSRLIERNPTPKEEREFSNWLHGSVTSHPSWLPLQECLVRLQVFLQERQPPFPLLPPTTGNKDNRAPDSFLISERRLFDIFYAALALSSKASEPSPKQYPGPYFHMRLNELLLMPPGWAISEDGKPEGFPVTVQSARYAIRILEELQKEKPIFNPSLGATLEGELEISWFSQGLVIQVGETEITVFRKQGNDMLVQSFAFTQIGDLVAAHKSDVLFKQ